MRQADNETQDSEIECTETCRPELPRDESISRLTPKTSEGIFKNSELVNLIPSCFQILRYEFLKAYLVLCQINQFLNV